MKVLKCLASLRNKLLGLSLVVFLLSVSFAASDTSVFSVGVLCSKSQTDNRPQLSVFTDVNYANLAYALSGQETVSYTIKTRVFDLHRNEAVLDTVWSITLPSSPPPRDLRAIALSVDTGFYRVECSFSDARNGLQELENRNVYSIDFSNMSTSISSTLLGTDVELSRRDTIFTPYFDTNVASIVEDPIFAYAELYAPLGSVRLVQPLLFDGDEVLAAGRQDTIYVTSTTTRVFTRIPSVDSSKQGVYSLKILIADEQDSILVYSQRLMDYKKSLALGQYTDSEIEAMTLQLRYVAEPEEVQQIESKTTPEARRKALANFWTSKDPFPATNKNEAFLEYYQRIEYANSNYGSYTSGWLTDRGHIHIVYGHPQSKRAEFSTFRGTQTEVWTYNHASYEFVDRTGFGDYVLVGPRPTEKFKYK